MATLKGQNFRILTVGDDGKLRVVGMSTSCTITITNNTEDATHKDVVGNATRQQVTSQTWSVQVESLDVTDTAAMLTAAKTFKKFTLWWDETSTTNNQEVINATDFAIGRQGQAFLNDATFSFNDRESSTKQLQFTGASPLDTIVGNHPEQVIVTPAGFTKGQYVRLLIGAPGATLPIASAKQLSLHLSVQLEDSTSKDTEGSFQIQEPVSYSYDISTTALMRSSETITSQVGAKTLADIEQFYQNAADITWEIANMGGANQRTKQSVICSGTAAPTTLTLNGPNRQNADYTAQFVGQGELSVAA